MVRTFRLALATIVLGGIFISCQWENVPVVIQGRVVDRSTGLGIGGARVSDGNYGESRGTSTDGEGHYSYTSWYEEHLITATAPGYQPRTLTLITKTFGTEPSQTLEFVLEKQ